MNATATPAKVARVGASRPRPAEARHPEPVDPPITRADMPAALMVWAVAPLLAILLGYWIAS
jgi:hypothetical protein